MKNLTSLLLLLALSITTVTLNAQIRPTDLEEVSDNDECNVYEVNYDSLDNYIKRVVKYAKKNKLDYPKHLNFGQLKKRFLKDTISKKKQTTSGLYEDFSEKRYGMKNTNDFSDINLKDEYSQNFPAYPAIEYIPLKFIQYEDTNGNFPATEAQIRDAIGVVNDNFRRNFVGIRFYLDCNVLTSTCVACGNNPTPIVQSVMYLTSSFQAITVHLLHDNDASTGTYPWVPLSYNIAIKNLTSLMNGTTFTHELGHNLGLYHTHRGRNVGQSLPLFGFFFSEIDNHDSPTCYQESVSRTRTQPLNCTSSIGQKKCDKNGDELCDTSASPKLGSTYNNVRWNSAGCQYIWNGTDNWGSVWNPQMKNYMSYTQSCRNNFTAGQISRMESYVPSFATSSNSYSISYTTQSGGTQICPGETVTLSVPSSLGALSYAWHVPPGWTVQTPGLTMVPEEEGWTVHRGVSANSITLQAPNSSQITQSTLYWIGVNLEGCELKPADIQFVVTKLDLINNYTQYCQGEEYLMESTLDATYSLSNSSWSIVSGQGTFNPKIKIGTGSCTMTATYTCYQVGPFSVTQSATLNLTSKPNCSGGSPMIANSNELVESYYPNPSPDGRIFLNLKESGNNEIMIYNENGDQILSECMESSSLDINLPDKKGVYYIKVFNGSEIQTIKILKQ